MRLQPGGAGGGVPEVAGKPIEPLTIEEVEHLEAAVHFRNFAALQMEMGHRDSSLLRTRHVYAGKTNEASTLRYFRV